MPENKYRRFAPELNKVKEFFPSLSRAINAINAKLRIGEPFRDCPELYELLWRMMEQIALLQEAGDASFVTAVKESALKSARRLLAGTGITLEDKGAGRDLVISASGGYPPLPLDVSYIKDDFLGGRGVNDTATQFGGSVGELGWGFYGTNAGFDSCVPIDQGEQFGVYRLATGNLANDYAMIFGPNLPIINAFTQICNELQILQVFNDPETFVSRWKIRPNAADTDTHILFGYCHDNTVGNIGGSPNGFYFQKRYADTTWQAVIHENAADTRFDTGIPVENIPYDALAPNFRTFIIEKISSTQLRFAITDGRRGNVYSDQIVENPPGGSTWNNSKIGRVLYVKTQAASSKDIYIHYFDQLCSRID